MVRLIGPHIWIQTSNFLQPTFKHSSIHPITPSVLLNTYRCAGYVFQRVGKIAATAVGGGFLLLQARLRPQCHHS